MNKDGKGEETDALLARLVEGDDLSVEEAKKLIYHIFVFDTDGIRFATWIGANHAKGETSDELLGFINASKELSTKFELDININKTTDLSGSGGGKFKTFNVSTTASFVVAAAGYTVAKEAYFGVTSPTGSADVFMALGIDFMKLSKKRIESVLKKVGICPVITPFISPRLANRGKLALKFFVQDHVRVRTPFHLVSNLQLTVPMNHRIYGCYSQRYLEILANLFLKMGYKKTLTFSSDIGMPEISNVGSTTIVEQSGEKTRKYRVRPQDLGVKEAKEKDIKTGGKEQNIADFINILKGKEKGARADLVAINAGAALYALNDVKEIRQGTKKAQQFLARGEGYKKLELLIRLIGKKSFLDKYQ
ncbi:anthranilate phosphoribosyltransferase [Candidatus Roizmanbacteria bacterium CG_4_8_14_3_um_filter_36_10]|uniref:Anthranilate phosphoribosyltransferase n=3 Tax=Candidatus Roizmaniibacteriota TaxID=1752723 RepID=A0A2M7BX38_9BACT|nr:MAG: anthranilate phosphoribosyltransferase [Candidatus Roizmanbacteria bacterium CG03_land_8_20_14_0_80_35_26]PJC82214.1 MAG: anthranilate phosphoribosyltransferase [Candidatus Roizmanbacteria bacterium CG_4_8_14_3_um_filter_36_10]